MPSPLPPQPTLWDRPALSTPLAQALLTRPPQPAPSAQRFLILVPDHPVHEVQLARAIWGLTHLQPATLVFISLVANEARALRARRRLATLAALARDQHNPVETRLVTGTWLSAVRTLWLPGDVVLCHAELIAPHWGQRQTLAAQLITRYRMPVYLLSGFYPKLNQPPTSPWPRFLIFDGVAAAVLVVFLLLQVALQALDPMWLRQLLVGLSVVLECGLLAFWHTYVFEDSADD